MGPYERGFVGPNRAETINELVHPAALWPPLSYENR
jgi:hypothetical protein